MKRKLVISKQTIRILTEDLAGVLGGTCTFIMSSGPPQGGSVAVRTCGVSVEVCESPSVHNSPEC